MKKVSVIVLVIVGLMFAAYAEAAKPKRRTRNANRIGPYAGVLIGQDSYSNDQTQNEADLASILDGLTIENLRVGTKDSDIGYQAAFGFRFSRYFAAEIALAQYGDLTTTVRADVIDNGDAIPVSLKLNFSVGGPVISGIGVVPFGDKFELYGRAGMLFASSERAVSSRVDGEPNSFGSAKSDSTELVLGLGFAWHINQMYSIRGEYQKIDGIGEDTGGAQSEDMTSATVGLIVRF
jgi:opacity protein-like surface antigen